LSTTLLPVSSSVTMQFPFKCQPRSAIGQFASRLRRNLSQRADRDEVATPLAMNMFIVAWW
jgi:hypothetical protein